ncbi:MAG: hypothetical protein FWE18_00695 [Alphaproteobacteria bacterium]|nr:hypothetical protein [Alphaproteobacteria bacterium]
MGTELCLKKTDKSSKVDFCGRVVSHTESYERRETLEDLSVFFKQYGVFNV